GQPVTLTATVSSADPNITTLPTGIVQFFSGTTSLGNVTLSGGVAIMPNVILPAGNNSITAQYGGNGSFNTSDSPAVMVNVDQASTAATLTASPASSVTGQLVTLTANVMALPPGGGTPSGSVEFFATAGSQTTSLGMATLTNGVATRTTTALLPADT